MYEISNENRPPSTAWQCKMIRFIHDDEKTLPKQHPVGMTFPIRPSRPDSTASGIPLYFELPAGTSIGPVKVGPPPAT